MPNFQTGKNSSSGIRFHDSNVLCCMGWGGKGRVYNVYRMEKSKIRKEYHLNEPPCRRVMCGGRIKGNAGHWDE